MQNNKTPLSTTYKQTLYYEMDDDSISPPTIIYQALSRKDILDIHSHSYKTNTNIYAVLSKSIKGCLNIYDINNNPITDIDTIINILPAKHKNKLYKNILESSVVNKDLVDKLKININLAFDDKFSTDTWDCELCKYKGLDKLRNCKFREDYEDIKKSDFSVRVGDVDYDYCPMYEKDMNLIHDMFDCFNCYDKGLLPDSGAYFDQTDFFYYAVSLISTAKVEQQKKAMGETTT